MKSLNPDKDQQKTRRKPNGNPEFHGVDDMLAHAVNGEEFARLPGKGKPLELGD